MKNESLYVATRVENMPVPRFPAVKRECTICNKDVWVTEWSYLLAQISTIVCLQCVTE